MAKNAALRREAVDVINDGQILTQRPVAISEQGHLPEGMFGEIGGGFDAVAAFRLRLIGQLRPFQRHMGNKGASAGQVMQGEHGFLRVVNKTMARFIANSAHFLNWHAKTIACHPRLSGSSVHRRTILLRQLSSFT